MNIEKQKTKDFSKVLDSIEDNMPNNGVSPDGLEKIAQTLEDLSKRKLNYEQKTKFHSVLEKFITKANAIPALIAMQITYNGNSFDNWRRNSQYIFKTLLNLNKITASIRRSSYRPKTLAVSSKPLRRWAKLLAYAALNKYVQVSKDYLNQANSSKNTQGLNVLLENIDLVRKNTADPRIFRPWDLLQLKKLQKKVKLSIPGKLES